MRPAIATLAAVVVLLPSAALAACAPSAAIIDEFAPYLWQGANACATCADAYDADARARGITGQAWATGKNG